ncbi:MAG TPA: fatty acid desaturase [Haliangiales bacterium]|nr:fatty acid desaturase [Haliangiales bacterium]
MAPQPAAYYTRELRPALGEEVFRPTPGRLVWLALHVAAVALAIATIAAGIGGLPVAALLSVAIGCAFAGMAFIAHETLHGAVVRGARLRRWVGFVAFLPFYISPRHWVAWHNRMHHNHTGEAGVDPDAYPTLERYRTSRRTRLADRLSFGGRRILGLVTLLIGLNGQSIGVLIAAGPRARYLPRRDYAWALVETAAQLGAWIALGALLGARVLLFGWLLPLAVGNVFVMAHILTNHSLSPHTELNDPLANSLSVTAPRWFERFTLHFGLHVEHHLFPSVSGRYTPRIRDLIRKNWPERYSSLPLADAVARLFRTGRIYKDARTLIDPQSGAESATL